MSAPIRIKRRTAGNPGAPVGLLNAELAFNEVDNTLYIGKGTGGAGGAASAVEPIGGSGAFVAVTGDQTVGGKKTFTVLPESAATPTDDKQLTTMKWVSDTINDRMANAGIGDMLKSVYDKNNDGVVDKAALADLATNATNAAHADTASDAAKATLADNATNAVNATNADKVPWTGITGKPTEFTPASHVHPMNQVTGLDAALAAKAPLASPTFTGIPKVPQPLADADNAQIATTKFVNDAIEHILGVAPESLNTLQELAEALGNDPNFAGTMTVELGKKLEKASNLSDLADKTVSRTNLGLKSMAIQAADAVAITGGTIDGVTIDGGTF